MADQISDRGFRVVPRLMRHIAFSSLYRLSVPCRGHRKTGLTSFGHPARHKGVLRGVPVR